MTVEELGQLIQVQVQGAEVFARDLTGEGNHFEAVIVSESFIGRGRLERQRLVMGALAKQLEGPLHALTIKTYTPEEWEKV